MQYNQKIELIKIRIKIKYLDRYEEIYFNVLRIYLTHHHI